MSEQRRYEDLPPSRVIFQDTSVDESLALTVWLDNEPETDLMKELGAMGTVRVYDIQSGELYHQERMPLSRSAVYGPGPNDDEVERWSNIISLFTDEGQTGL
ncbi:hypothetical protein H0X09_03650 [Candidatus Saccharibacteria bacterium]|nr:hypothetical protein [Candidatus Saccharibacteria bacterium]